MPLDPRTLGPSLVMVHLNLILVSYLVFFCLRSAVQVSLNRLNNDYLRRHGDRVPKVFEGWVNLETLEKISAYTRDSARFGLFSTFTSQVYFLLILLSGLLPWLTGALLPTHWGLLIGGLVFFGALSLLLNLLGIPLDLYDTFVIEARHGFNTKTWKIWLSDLLKSLILSAILGGLLLSLLLALITHGGSLWWLWAWAAVGSFELLILWLYPVVIAPLFNKFEPIGDENLVQRIEALMASVGLKAKGVFQMDASKRSKHTNAYFTGLGKSKRVVLFDTLLSSHRAEEIIAVLAHELGHWKKKHILKQLILIEAASLLGFFISAQLLNWPYLYRTFGFPEPIACVGLLLIGAVFSPLGFFLHPIEAAFSRRMEREADDFAKNLLNSGEALADSLRRIAKDNLANLNPHPIYAWFYYSHPTLVERISRLTDIGPPRKPFKESLTEQHLKS